MNKGLAYIIVSTGLGIGSWIPTLFGAGILSGWSIVGSLIGGIAAIVVIYKNI